MKTFVDLYLAGAIVKLITLVSNQLQKPTPVVVWDAGQYYSMARQFAGSPLRCAGALAFVIVTGFPFASRGLNALRNVPTASSNVYLQQYQMGLFLDRSTRGGRSRSMTSAP